jgi:hypothetical protein
MRPRSALSPLLALALLCTAATARAQARSEADRDELLRERAVAVAALGAWALANVAAGSYLLLADPAAAKGHTPDPEARAFRRSFGALGLAYGIVNGAIAAGALASLLRERETLTAPGLVQFRRRQSADIVALNVGLEMLNVGVGAALWVHGPSGLARGAGAAFVVQNSFLVGYDGLCAIVYRH